MTMTGTVLRAAAPIVLWGLHFVTLYVLISASCAPRGLIATERLAVIAALLTAAAAIATLVLLVIAGRGLRRARDPAMEQAAWWSALISFLAILANAWPVVSLPGCTG
jgi:hypothetical protein